MSHSRVCNWWIVHQVWKLTFLFFLHNPFYQFSQHPINKIIKCEYYFIRSTFNIMYFLKYDQWNLTLHIFGYITRWGYQWIKVIKCGNLNIQLVILHPWFQKVGIFECVYFNTNSQDDYVDFKIFIILCCRGLLEKYNVGYRKLFQYDPTPEKLSIQIFISCYKFHQLRKRRGHRRDAMSAWQKVRKKISAWYRILQIIKKNMLVCNNFFHTKINK